MGEDGVLGDSMVFFRLHRCDVLTVWCEGSGLVSCVRFEFGFLFLYVLVTRLIRSGLRAGSVSLVSFYDTRFREEEYAWYRKYSYRLLLSNKFSSVCV